MKYRSEIDGLRALAVVPVILFHAGFKAFSGGFVGVDVFFVISGYLITTILLNDLEAGKFSIVHFYERRARRILPALFLVMLACLPFAWFWLLPMEMKQFSKSLVAVSAFASNVFFWLTSGYFDTSTELKPLIHTWSLSVEEQFYVLFPLLLLLMWKAGKQWTIAILTSLAVLSLVLAQRYAYESPSFAFYMLPTRAWELLIGAFVAFYYSEQNIKKHKYWVSELGSLLGFALICYATFDYSDTTPFPSLYALAPTIGAALIIVFATNRTLIGKILSSKPFLWVGLISYSAYLWHQPLFAFARQRSIVEPSQQLLGLLTIITLPLSYLTWRFIERPFRNKNRFTRKQVFSLSAIGTACFCIFGLLGWKTLGYENRLPIEQRDSILFGPPTVLSGSPNNDHSCLEVLRIRPSSPDEICITNSNQPTTLVYGDSHASALYKAIFDKSIRLDAMVISKNGCFAFPELDLTDKNTDDTCKKIGKQAEYVSNSLSSISTVIIGHRVPELSDEESGYQINGKRLTKRQAETLGLELLTSTFTKQGKNVVVIIDNPILNQHPRNCLQELSWRKAEKLDCRITKETYEKDRDEYVKVLKKIAAKNPRIAIYDPIEVFCDGEYCKLTDANKSLYYDIDHISTHGSLLIFNQLLQEKLLTP